MLASSSDDAPVMIAQSTTALSMNNVTPDYNVFRFARENRCTVLTSKALCSTSSSHAEGSLVAVYLTLPSAFILLCTVECLEEVKTGAGLDAV